MRKPDFCLCESKCADQLRRNCVADQRLCFRCKDSTIPPQHIPKISRFYLSSVMSDLVGNPEDQLSCVAAHFKLYKLISLGYICLITSHFHHYIHFKASFYLLLVGG